MMPFTHELLGQYIGTSREIVTQYMNQFRHQGYLSYSRKGILIHPKKIEDWLANEQPAQANNEQLARADKQPVSATL